MGWSNGNRAAKGTITTMSCDPTTNGFSATANYVLDQAGHQLSRFAPDTHGNIALDYTNVYAAGTLMATYDGNNLHFYLNDWLGTRRVQTNYAGVVEQQCMSLPYGDSETCGPGILFTGKERDSESGNDYFGARYFGSSMGRFLSPDPYGNSVADFTNPQSWNMYSYVLNNPLKFVDPTGLDCAYLNDAGTGIESSDRNSSIGECNSHGGYWVSGMVNQMSVNDDGTYRFGYTSTDANGNISTGVYANYLAPTTDNSLSSAYSAAGSLLTDFLTGSGADVRNYDLSTIQGRDILNSKGIQQLNQRIKAGCAAGVQAGPVAVSSGQAAANIPYDVAHLPTGGQVGGYAGGHYQNSGDSTDITFTNVAGAKSFFYHAVPDRPSGSKGLARSITQNFTLAEPNPCTHP